MTGIEWLILLALGALALWVTAGVIEARAERRPLPRIVQSNRHAPPPLPPTRQPANLPRARAVRRCQARRRMEGIQ